MKIPDKLYDVLKWLCIVVIPALTTLYTVVDGVFAWGHGEMVSTISAAVCACIGAIIGVSTASYYKGVNDGVSE